ncbi:MAG: NUDIX domain-containing protein [Alistipes sp.]|nr:NUDIX domain-containing protein [Alistipes sp.]
MMQKPPIHYATSSTMLPLPFEADGSIRLSFAEAELLLTSCEPVGDWHCIYLAADEHISRAKITTFLGKYNKVAILSPSPQALFESIAQQFKWIEAAGGVVENPSGEVVMIRRSDRWDLPKGHREEGESYEVCAAREAEEETGVSVSSVGRLLARTIHCYQLFGCWEMKFTAWYAMQAEQRCVLSPQQSEGIICAEWVKREDIERYISHSFPTIKTVFASFLDKKN